MIEKRKFHCRFCAQDGEIVIEHDDFLVSQARDPAAYRAEHAKAVVDRATEKHEQECLAVSHYRRR